MTGSTFASGSAVAEVAAAIGDTARATILAALADGRAHTAGELAWEAGITPQTTSGHLAKLDAVKLIAAEKQGRHRYFRLASPEVAHAIEALMVLVSVGPIRHRPPGPRDEAMREARTCYDHLAGRIGVALSDALVGHGHLVLEDGAGAVTNSGERFLRDFGIDLASGRRSTRPLCRTCVDWSERRTHLAGRLGAALCMRCEELDWITRAKDSRAVTITQRLCRTRRDIRDRALIVASRRRGGRVFVIDRIPWIAATAVKTVLAVRPPSSGSLSRP